MGENINNLLFLGIKSKFKEKSGYLLMSVVLLFLVLIIVVSSLTFTTLANKNASDYSSDHNAIYYYAESGLNEFTDYLYTYLENMSGEEMNRFTSLTSEEISTKLEHDIISIMETSTELMGSEAKRVISLSPNGEEIVIKSVATLNEISRSVSQSIYNIKDLSKGSEGITHAMMARDKLELRGGGTIDGSLKITHPVEGSLVVRNSGKISIQDNIIFGKLPTNTDVSKIITGGIPWNTFVDWISSSVNPKYVIENDNEEFPHVEMPPIPETSTSIKQSDFINGKQIYNGGLINVTFNNGSTVEYSADATLDLGHLPEDVINVSLKSLKQTNGLNHSNSFIIDVGDRNFNLIVDQLVVNSRVLVKGTGNLRIMVKDTPSMESVFSPLKFTHAFDEKLSKEKIAIVLYNNSSKPKNLVISGSNTLNVYSLVAENHNLTIEEGAKYSLHVMLLGEGNNFTTPADNVGEYPGKWDFIFVPKGTVHFRTTSFIGAIMARTAIFENTGAKITFKNEYTSDMPDEFCVFNPSYCEAAGGGSGNNSGGSKDKLSFGPIREVRP